MVELKRKLNIKSNNYLSVLEIINSKNHKARLVGGVVRDAVLGIESQDIDIITTMWPEGAAPAGTSRPCSSRWSGGSSG